MMDKYGYKIPIDSLRAYILRWLGLSEIRSEIASACVEAKKFSFDTIGEAVTQEANKRHQIEVESISRDKSTLDQVRLNHESILNNVKDIVELHVEEHITKLQSSQHRFVSCPVCGKNYNLAASGAAYNTRAITIVCDNCKSQFEVRPSLFWNKIEVEKR